MKIENFYEQGTQIWQRLKMKVCMILLTKGIFLLLGNSSPAISPTFKFNFNYSPNKSITNIKKTTNVNITNVIIIQSESSNTTLKLHDKWNPKE